MAFAMMVSAAPDGVTPLALVRGIAEEMAEVFALLLNDESGTEREKIARELRKLWAVYEEQTEGPPWILS